jgi:hypothetical protein
MLTQDLYGNVEGLSEGDESDAAKPSGGAVGTDDKLSSVLPVIDEGGLSGLQYLAIFVFIAGAFTFYLRSRKANEDQGYQKSTV